MKLASKLFDRIRISHPPRADVAVDAPSCEHPGCVQPGTHRAPKGRSREGQYFQFCIDHVRAYNKSYNYFAGMPDPDIDAYLRDEAATGHRPTWTMGVNADGRSRPTRGYTAWTDRVADTFGMFGGGPRGAEQRFREAEPERRPLKNMERRSFAVLDLEGSETAEEIKARFKALVKKFHPDANGGDRSFEDRLREILQAYGYLRSAGFC